MKSFAMRVVFQAVAALSLMAFSGVAAADEEREIDRRGVYLGFAGMGNFVVNQSSAPVNGFIAQGGGGAVFFGVRLASVLALEAGYSLNVHNPVRDYYGATTSALLLHSGTLDLKFIFPNHSSLRPFVEGGLGLYELAAFPNGTDFRNGLGFQLGGGLDIWLGRHLSLGARALYHGVSFTENIGNGKPFLSTVSVEGNLQLHF